MKNLNQIVLSIVIGISVLTVAVGTYAWMHLECAPLRESGFIGEHEVCPLEWDQALYAGILAIGGSDIYHAHPDPGVKITRWLGALSGLAFVLGLLAILAADRLRRRRIKGLSNHLVLIGVNDFSLSYLQALKGPMDTVVLVDTEAALAKHPVKGRRFDTMRAEVDFIDDHALNEMLGMRPAKVIFGDAKASLNVERAHSLVALRGPFPMLIRSEKQNINADLDLWSKRFAEVPILSETELTARALVTELEPMNIARIRQQAFPHIAIIGIGDMALGIIEELRLRCHAHDLGPLMVSTFDRNAKAAWKKLKMERGGLLDEKLTPETQELDGVECGSIDLASDPLIAAAGAKSPLTAIIVCTGDDEVNVDIALRLRRIQEKHAQCMAPILMRSRATSTIAPEPVTDLSSGIFRFGGPQVRSDDLAFEKMQTRLGKAMHEKWNEAEPNYASSWDSLDLGQRRTNTRAALSAVEMFQTLGLVPPKGASAADLRVHPDVLHGLDVDTLMPQLTKSEHNRWVAERFAEGWVQTTAKNPTKADKDNRRKIHWLMMPFDQLKREAAEEIPKDSNNVLAIFNEARRQYDSAPNSPSWKKRVRIGLMGPLIVSDDASFKTMLRDVRSWFQKNGIKPATHRLEIVSPNAPGFDRIAARVLLKDWHQQRGTGDLLLVQSETELFLDAYAAKQVDASCASNQTRALMRAVTGRSRRLRLRAAPVLEDEFMSHVKADARKISDMCALMIYAAREGGGQVTKDNAARRALQNKDLLWAWGENA